MPLIFDHSLVVVDSKLGFEVYLGQAVNMREDPEVPAWCLMVVGKTSESSQDYDGQKYSMSSMRSHMLVYELKNEVSECTVTRSMETVKTLHVSSLESTTHSRCFVSLRVLIPLPL